MMSFLRLADAAVVEWYAAILSINALGKGVEILLTSYGGRFSCRDIQPYGSYVVLLRDRVMQ